MKPQTLFIIGLLMVIGVFSLWAVSDHPAPVQAPQEAAWQEQVRTPGDFDGIISRFGGTVKVEQGSPASVKISGDPKVADKLRTELRGHTLEIFADSRARHLSDLEVVVTMPEITLLTLTGNGDLEATNGWTFSRLSVSVAGNGDLNLRQLQGKHLQVNVAGNGDMDVQGGAIAEASLNIAGNGDLNLESLQIGEASVSLAGSGDLVLTATTRLDATIAGSGNIRYHGQPAVTQKILGSGELEAIED